MSLKFPHTIVNLHELLLKIYLWRKKNRVRVKSNIHHRGWMLLLINVYCYASSSRDSSLSGSDNKSSHRKNAEWDAPSPRNIKMSGENVSICKERPTLSISLSLQHILVLFDLSTHIRPAILSALRNQRPLFLQLLNPMKSSAIHLICYTLLQIIWFHLIRTIKITIRHGQDDLWLKLSLGFREWSEKEEISSQRQFSGRKCLNARDHERMAWLLWNDSNATVTPITTCYNPGVV